METSPDLCGCCEPWPCDTATVLAALTAAEARAEQAERERDAARRRVWTLRPALDLAVKRLREIEPSYRDYHEGGEIWRVIEIGARAMDETSGPLSDAPNDDDNARLRSRLATVEAALLHRCVVQRVEPTCEDCQTIIAALAATPAAVLDEIILPALQTRTGFGTIVSVSVRPDLVLEGEDATPAAGETHDYTGACSHTDHEGCTCMYLVNGKWCGRSRFDAVHDRREQQRQHGGEG